MLLWLFSLIIPSAFSTIIDSHNTHINYDLVYQSNLDVFQNNSLRFSTALQEQQKLEEEIRTNYEEPPHIMQG